MLATLVPLSLVLIAAEIPDARTGASAQVAPAASEPAAEGNIVAGLRQRPSTVPLKRGIHELKDPGGWPAEPPAVAGPIDAARFDAAVVHLCGEVARDEGLPELARVVREVAAETKSDPFMLAALAYREGRCRPWLVTSSGVGLLQIKASMFAAGGALAVSARGSRSREAARSRAQPARRRGAARDVGA